MPEAAPAPLPVAGADGPEGKAFGRVSAAEAVRDGLMSTVGNAFSVFSVSVAGAVPDRAPSGRAGGVTGDFGAAGFAGCDGLPADGGFCWTRFGEGGAGGPAGLPADGCATGRGADGEDAGGRGGEAGGRGGDAAEDGRLVGVGSENGPSRLGMVTVASVSSSWALMLSRTARSMSSWRGLPSGPRRGIGVVAAS